MKQNLKISGTKVHDVGYRAFLLEAAEDLGLPGFQARNIVEDGRQAVAVLLEGEENALAEMQRIARTQKPENAVVDDIAFSDYTGQVEAIESFAGKFQARQLRKGISSIIRMEKKQDQMLDKQDQMLDKQDQMLSLQSRTIDELSEVKLEITSELRETRKEIVGKLDEARVEIAGEVGKARDTIVEKLDENQKATGKAIRESSEAVIEELRDSRENTEEDIRNLRVDLRSTLDKKLSRMEKDISQLKARSGA